MADTEETVSRQSRSHQEAIWSQFDERLFLLKLDPIIKQRNRQIKKEIGGIHLQRPPTGHSWISQWMRIQIAHLKRVPEQIYQVACEVWEIQGEEKTPEFVWAIVHKAILPGIEGRKNGVWDEFQRNAAAAGVRETDVRFGSGKQSLEAAVTSIKGEWRVKMETETRELKHEQRRERLEREKLMPNQSLPAQGGNQAVAHSHKRALGVAEVVKELNILSKEIYSRKEYADAKQKHPDFLTFQATEINANLEMEVRNLAGSRPPRWLACRIVAAIHGRSPATVQSDWKKHKPAKVSRPGTKKRKGKVSAPRKRKTG